MIVATGALFLLVAEGIAPMPSSASTPKATISTKDFPSLGICQSGLSKALMLSYPNVRGMSRSPITETFGKPVEEPIVTEPVENHVGTRPSPAASITESLRNATLPWYTNATLSKKITNDPNALSQFVETIAWFRNANKQESYLQQISRVNESQFMVPGKNIIKVKYLGESSQISVPNSVYVVATTMPDAPVLVFYSLRIGALVTTFAFYGGKGLDVASTSQYVNLGVQVMFEVCS